MTAAGGFAVDILTRPQDLAELEGEWSRLWNAQPRREVFTSYAWNLAAHEAFGASARPRLVVVRKHGAVVGLLPLRADRDGVRFLSGSGADYNDMLVAGEASSEIVEAALRAVITSAGPGPRVLDNLPEWSVLMRSLERLPADLRSRIEVEERQPCPALRLGEDRAGILAAMLGKQSLKRHEKKLAKLGALSLRHLEDRQAIHGMLPDFFAQHVARRALAGERSLFLEAGPRAFYTRLVERFDPARELRFAVLEVDTRPVAYHLGFEVAGRFTWYKPTFDVDYWDYGAGEVLLKRLLEYVRDHEIAEFDFTQGAESFKDRFSNHVGLNVRWTLHPSPAAAQAASARRRARARLAADPRAAALRPGLRALASGPWRDRPARFARHVLAPLARSVWSREQVTALSADRQAVASRPSSRDANVMIRRGSLRDLAMACVSEQPLMALQDLSAARARLARDTVYLGFAGDSPSCMAWLGTRSEIGVDWEGGGASRVELPAPAAVVEVPTDSAGRPSAAIIAAVIEEMARAGEGSELWLLAPAGAETWMQAASRLGFVPRYRLTATRLLNGQVRAEAARLGERST